MEDNPELSVLRDKEVCAPISIVLKGHPELLLTGMLQVKKLEGLVKQLCTKSSLIMKETGECRGVRCSRMSTRKDSLRQGEEREEREEREKESARGGRLCPGQCN
jgi:hypothetical protein